MLTWPLSAEFLGSAQEYKAEHVFIRHVVLPNGKRPQHEPGHPLYMNFYKEDVLKAIKSYQPILQFVFAHYATLEQYFKASLSQKMDPQYFPGAWGAGNGKLRMKRSEFVCFCDNFGLIGCTSRLQGLHNGLVFTKDTANWVFTSAKNGAESEAMCEECTSAQLPGCEHMTFREFIEAILRCAVILYPLDGMQAPDIDMAPSCTFRKTGKQLGARATLLHSHTRMRQHGCMHYLLSHFISDICLRAPDHQGPLKKLLPHKADPNEACPQLIAELRSPTYVATIISCNLNVLACLEHVFSANIFTIKRTLMISAGFLTLSSLPFVLALAFALCLLSLFARSLSRALSATAATSQHQEKCMVEVLVQSQCWRRAF